MLCIDAQRGASETTRETPLSADDDIVQSATTAMLVAGPAGAVIQRPQALSGITGRKGCVGGCISLLLNATAYPRGGKRNGTAGECERSVELTV